MTLTHWLKQIFGLEKFGTPAPTKPQKSKTAPDRRSLDEEMVVVAEELAAERIRETSPNQGPGIERLWTATDYGVQGYKNREPWCATSLCWIVKEAAFRIFGLPPYPFTLPMSAGVVRWKQWALDNSSHWQLLDPAKATVQEGDIVAWDFNGPDKASGTHIGLAMSDEQKNGTFETAEGNTNAQGSREGNGFYIKSDRTRRMAIFIIRFIG